MSSLTDLRDLNIRGIQTIDQSAYRLMADGLVSNKKEYTYHQVVNQFRNYEKVVTLHCIQGWSTKILWEGVLVSDLRNDSSVNSNVKVVIFHASDGYTTAMPINYLYENEILLALKMNGLVLTPEKGFPLQIVAESKYGYKWIKWITEIELSDNENYLGYWESRGYSNDAKTP